MNGENLKEKKIKRIIYSETPNLSFYPFKHLQSNDILLGILHLNVNLTEKDIKQTLTEKNITCHELSALLDAERNHIECQIPHKCVHKIQK